MAKTEGSAAQNTLWIIGAIFAVQGIGSAITEAVWHSSFGVSGILIHYGVPTWSSWIIGGIGVVTLACAAGLAVSKR